MIAAMLFLMSPAHAGPSKFRQLPPLAEVRIFASDARPDVRILYGRHAEGRLIDQPYVVEIDRRRTWVPRVREKELFDPNEVSLTYPDGAWLFADASGKDASIVHPAREREHLTALSPTPAVLAQLHARVRFAAGFTPALPGKIVAEPGPPAGRRLVRVRFPDAAAAQAFVTDNPLVVTGQPSAPGEPAGLNVWIFDHDAAATTVDAARAGLEIVRTDRLSPADVAAPPNQPVPASARELWRYLERLDGSLESLRATDHALDYYRESTPARRAFADDFLRPLQTLITAGYDRLRALNSDLGIEVYLFAHASVGPRLAQIDWTAGEGRGSFFAEWINFLTRRTNWVGPSENVVAKAFVRGGHALVHFPEQTVYYVDYLPPGTSEFTEAYLPLGTSEYLQDQFPTYPLRALGLENSPRRRAALIRFVLMADKSAEWQRVNAKADLPEPDAVRGNQTLARVIRALPYGVSDHRTDPGFTRVKFRPALYLTQAAQILTELLDTSHVTLTNYATYLTILDAALNLQLEIEREFGTNPSAGGHSLERDRLTTETFNLYKAVQSQTVRTCAVFLGKKRK